MRRLRIFDHNRYAFRRGNCIDLLSDGDNFYPRMLSAIENAKHTIIMEQYLVKSGSVLDQFINAFCKAAQRGVNVVLLLDDYGCRGLFSHDRKRIENAGIKLHFYNPVKLSRFVSSLFRNHRKLLMVDGSVAFVGGAGISDEFLLPQQAYQNTVWRDVVLEIKGPVIADWLDLFRRTIKQTSASQAEINWDAVTELCNLDDMDQLAQVLIASSWHRQEISQAFLRHIKSAKHRVWFSTPYFVTTGKIRRALCQAARRGVDTRLLLPGEISDHPWVTYASQRFYPMLLEAGVKIFEYLPGFSHSKIQLVDNWASIGSCNLDRWNMHWNLDANQSIVSENFANSVESLMQANFELCNRVTTANWSRRSLLKRLKSSGSALFVNIIERIFSRF